MSAISTEDLQKYRQRIMALVAFGHRGSATSHEREAAKYLVDELRQAGYEPAQEPFTGSRSFGGRVVIHVVLATLGAICLWTMPALSLVAGTLAIASLWAEQTMHGVWLSRPLVRYPSANIVGMLSARAPRLRIVLCGHYDTQRAGWIWLLFQYFAPLLWYIPPALKPPLLPLGLVMLAQVVLSSIAWWSGTGSLVTIGGSAVLVIYAIHLVLLGQWACGPYVPGAGDNASGAAAVLTLAEAWRREPHDDVELVVLLTSCEEAGLLGSAAWADAHRDDLDALPTMFLNLDSFGFGEPRFFGFDVPLIGLPLAYPKSLVAEAAALAQELGLKNAGPHSMSGPTDGLSLLRHKIPGMTLLSFGKWGRMPHFHLREDTCQNLDFKAACRGVEFSWAMLQRMANRKSVTAK